MRDINSMSRGNALASNRHNSVSCTVRTSRQRSCNGLDVCNDWEKRAFKHAKLSGLGCYQPSPRLLVYYCIKIVD